MKKMFSMLMLVTVIGMTAAIAQPVTDSINNVTTTSMRVYGTLNFSPDTAGLYWFRKATNAAFTQDMSQSTITPDTSGASVNWNFTGLQSATQYFVQAVGYANGVTKYGNILVQTTDTVFTLPTVTLDSFPRTASAVTDYIQFTTGNDSVLVEATTAMNAAFTMGVTTVSQKFPATATSTNIQITGLLTGVQYWNRVRVKNRLGWSPPKVVSFMINPPSNIPKMSNLTVTFGSKLHWKYNWDMNGCTSPTYTFLKVNTVNNILTGTPWNLQSHTAGTGNDTVSTPLLPNTHYWAWAIAQGPCGGDTVMLDTITPPLPPNPKVSNLTGTIVGTNINWSYAWDTDGCSTGGITFLKIGTVNNITLASAYNPQTHAGGTGVDTYSSGTASGITYFAWAVMQTLCGGDTVQLSLTAPVINPPNITTPILTLDQTTVQLFGSKGLDSVKVGGTFDYGGDSLHLWAEIDTTMGFMFPSAVMLGTYMGTGFIFPKFYNLTPNIYYVRLGGYNSKYQAYSNTVVINVGATGIEELISQERLNKPDRILTIQGVPVQQGSVLSAGIYVYQYHMRNGSVLSRKVCIIPK